MKILYTTLETQSGSHLYYQRLAQTMQMVNVETETRFYSNRGIKELVPAVVKPFLKKRLSFDIIHSNADCSNVFKIKSKPFVVTVHHEIKHPRYEYYYSFAQRAYHLLLLKYIKRAITTADMVIAVSKNTEKGIKTLYGASNVRVIYNGIDPYYFKPMQVADPFPGKTKLLFIGNLIKRKGADLLPHIMERLDDRFVLFYTTGLRTKKKMFSDKRMIPMANIMPNSKELILLYNNCDIFLLPSRSEGLGYVFLEAMACGKPVVTTNCSSMPEVIDNEKGGFLCKMDDVKDFGDKIRLLAADKKLRNRMGEYNRKKTIKNFGLLKMAQEYKKVYKELLK